MGARVATGTMSALVCVALLLPAPVFAAEPAPVLPTPISDVPLPESTPAADVPTSVKPTDPSSVTLPYSLVATGGQGVAEATVALPPGTSPLRLRAKLVANYTRPGVIVLAVGGQVVARPSANTTTVIDIPLSAQNVAPAGAVTVTLTTKLDPSETCFVDDNYTATLSGVNVAYSSSPSQPATIAQFLATGVPSFTVVGTSNPSTPVLSAELNAVAALAYRSPTPTKVRYVPYGAPESSPTDRVVRIVPSTSATSATYTLSAPATLTITGPPSALPAAAAALGAPASAAVQTKTATNVGATATFATLTDPVPLAKLAVPPVHLSAVGSSSANIPINIPAFGFEAKTLNIHLLGATSAIPAGGQGRVDIFFNNVLIRSKPLGSAPRLDETITVDTPDVVRNNTLRVTLAYVPPSGNCVPALPALADVNVDTSTVQAVQGSPQVPTFNSFPQAFQQTVPVLFASTSVSSRMGAANLITALAGATPTQQLTVNVSQSLDAFPPGAAATMVVGASGSDLATLGAPVQIGSDLKVVGPAGQTFTSSTDPASLLETFTYKGRTVVVLAHTDGVSGLAKEVDLSKFVLTNPNGFATLTGSVALLGPSNAVVYIPLPPPPPPASKAPWLVAAGAALLIIVALALWLWRRPSRPAPPPLPGVPDTSAG